MGKPNISSRGDKNIIAPYEHHEAHMGNMYSSSHNATKNADETIEVLVITADSDSHAHMLMEVRGSGEARIECFEGPTTSSNGTALERTNHNRISANTAGTTVFHTPTVSDAGTQLNGFTKHFGNGVTVGGEVRANDEVILAPNTKYLIRLTSEAATNDLTVMLTWYESDDYY